MILALGHQTLPINETILVSIFIEAVHPIITIISHIFREDDANIATKATVVFLKQMM